MGQTFQWVPDMPSGIMRNHYLSGKLRYAAFADSKGMQFVKAEDGYGKRMGDTVTIPRVRNVDEPTSGLLSRTGKIPIDTLAISTRAITVAEYGRGLEFTEESKLLSKFDPEDMIQNRLKVQMKLTIDTVIFTAFKACQIRYGPTSAVGGTFTTDAGVTSQVATNNITVGHIKIIRDYLDTTIHAPTYENDTYMSLAAVRALRGIKDDPEWMGWRVYIQPEQAFFKGEVGEIEDIRFVKVNHNNALDDTVGTGSLLGEMLFFGQDPVVMCEVQTPELRAAIASDFGRQRAVAWYGVLAFGETWNTSNDGEARIIYVTSS